MMIAMYGLALASTYAHTQKCRKEHTQTKQESAVQRSAVSEESTHDTQRGHAPPAAQRRVEGVRLGVNHASFRHETSGQLISTVACKASGVICESSQKLVHQVQVSCSATAAAAWHE